MSVQSATGLAITNPLVKYRALVATKAISPDNGQLRLALHLHKLYERLKDYEPQVEYSQRLDQISRTVKTDVQQNSAPSGTSGETPPISRRNRTWRSILAAKEQRDSLALTQRLTSHESALQLTSPKGLMLHGEVGTGKSMLVDLFADCLPHGRKRRWHFNTFMLETFAKLESLRRIRSASPSANDGVDDYPLLWLAKDLIQTSPILFLDEFQMPDRAASKILTNLMTSFFHLGGVLVATSNRMPEELAKAAGIEFSPPPSRLESLGWQLGLRRRSGMGSGNGIFGGQSEFAAFLEVLKARCEVWEIEGGRDYRRTESETLKPTQEVEEIEGEWRVDGHEDLQHSAGMAGWPMAEEAKIKPELETGDQSYQQQQSASVPRYYHLSSEDSLVKDAAYQAALEQTTGERSSSISDDSRITFTPSQMRVYGRKIPIPRSHTSGVTDWTFDELCKTAFGPADYITLASTYHTLLLHDVPVLTSLMKNEARRFITLLDALYECRCKLFIAGASAGPDELFFPERKMKDRDGEEAGDAIQSETFSEAYQDATAPFRPNILTENPNYAEPDPEPNYTHARLAGLLNADALEDDPPNKIARTHHGKNPFGRSFGRSDAEMQRRPIDPDEPRYTPKRPDFGKTSAFTGEDERFAYKRAQSRLWEMCGSRWWARSEEGWHRPLPQEVRRWERSTIIEQPSTAALAENGSAVAAGQGSDVTIGGAAVDETRDERSFKHGAASPFRTSREPPPKISWTHVWGTVI